MHLGFLSGKEFQRPRHVRIFLFGLLPFFKRVSHSRSLVNDPFRSALEYSLADKYSTLSENAKISAVRSLADICFLHVLIRLIRCIIVSVCPLVF